MLFIEFFRKFVGKSTPCYPFVTYEQIDGFVNVKKDKQSIEVGDFVCSDQTKFVRIPNTWLKVIKIENTKEYLLADFLSDPIVINKLERDTLKFI